MSNTQGRIDVLAEINACEIIWGFDEARLDEELSKVGIDPQVFPRRLEAMLGLDARTSAGGAGGQSPHAIVLRSEETQPPPAPGIACNPQPSEVSVAAMASCAEALGTFEVAGPVKFYDSSKGFGFFVADDDQGDVLVHISCLRAAQYQTAHEGARIHAVVQRTLKGLQAVRILSMDESTAIHPSQLPQRTHEKVQPEGDWMRAVVKWYNRQRGFGFISEGERTPDCFIHADTLRRWGLAPLWPGQMVEVRWGTGSKGRMVAEIRYPDGLSGLPAVH